MSKCKSCGVGEDPCRKCGWTMRFVNPNTMASQCMCGHNSREWPRFDGDCFEDEASTNKLLWVN